MNKYTRTHKGTILRHNVSSINFQVASMFRLYKKLLAHQCFDENHTRLCLYALGQELLSQISA